MFVPLIVALTASLPEGKSQALLQPANSVNLRSAIQVGLSVSPIPTTGDCPDA